MTHLDHAQCRVHMVAEQIAPRVADRRILAAMEAVPRHLFIPPELQHQAYDDRPLPIGYEQTISQPLMVALLLDALSLEGNERVLDVGTGSGYQAALLGKLAREVYSVEIVPELARRAQRALERVGATNVVCDVRDGSAGWPLHAPFDAIVVAAGAPLCPTELVDQLAPGGRLVIPVGPARMQVLHRITKREERTDVEHLTPCYFVPLIGSGGWPESARKA